MSIFSLHQRSAMKSVRRPTKFYLRLGRLSGYSAWRRLGADLAAAPHDILVAGQLLDADRTASVEFVRTDADLGAHAKLGAIGKLRRRVMQHDGAIDLVEKLFRRSRGIRDDALGMLRTVLRDVGDSRGDVINDAHR